MLRRSLVTMLTLAAVGLLPGVAIAADTPAGVAPASAAAIRVGPNATATATLVNASAGDHDVTVRLDGAVAGEVGVTVGGEKLPAAATLSRTVTGGGRVDVVFTAEALTATSKGWLVVTDLDAGSASSVPVLAGPLQDATPGVTTWKVTASIWPWSKSAVISSVPITPASTCAAKASIDAVLVRGSDSAPAVLTCGSSGAVMMGISGMDPWTAGDYTGKLSVGGTDVDITVTRKACVWWALACLLLGALVALLARAYLAWRPVRALEGDVAEVCAPEAPAQWRKWLEDQVTVTKSAIRDSLPGRGTGDRSWKWRLITAPPGGTKDVVAAGRKDLQAAQTVLVAWSNAKTGATAVITGLQDLPEQPHLLERVEALRGATTAAQQAPPTADGSEGAARTGTTGISEVLTEAQALAGLPEVNALIDDLTKRLAEKQPVVYDTPWDLLAAQTHAAARQRLNGVEVSLGQTHDAVSADPSAELLEISRLVDQIPVRPVRAVGPHFAPESQEEGPAPVGAPERTSSGKWFHWPARLPRIAVGGPVAVIRLGDLLSLGLAVLLVTSAGLSLLYLGKAWGSGWDSVGAVAAACGGSWVLTPLFGAIDRLANPVSAEASDAV